LAQTSEKESTQDFVDVLKEEYSWQEREKRTEVKDIRKIVLERQNSVSL